jgi:hypothetical protein
MTPAALSRLMMITFVPFMMHPSGPTAEKQPGV